MTSRHLAATAAVGRAAILGKIHYMILHVNSVCNAKCRMCFNWDGMQERWDPKGHSVENLRKMAKSMRPLPQLTCSGGEPFLRKDLPEIIQAFYEEAGTRFFTIPTNSLLPDRVERLIDHFNEHCPKAFLNFCLPFHGDESHYDDIMGVPGNFEKFKKTYAVVQSKRKQNPNVSCVLNFVMSKFNYERYQDIIDMANRDFAEAPLGVAYARGVTHERDATDVPVEYYQNALAYVAANKKNHTRYNPYTLMFDTIGDQVMTIISGVVAGDVEDLHCGAGRHFLVAYDNGAVYPCELLEHVGIPAPKNDGETAPTDSCLGNLNDFGYDMSALLSSDHAKELINWIATHDCACTWECAIYSKIVHSPREIAKLGGNMVRYMFKERPKSASAAANRPE